MSNESTDQLQSAESLKISIRDYMREFVGSQVFIVESKIDALRDLTAQQHDSSGRAIDKAEQQMNARLLGMNEFRDQLRDQAVTFARKEQLDETRDGLRTRLEVLEKLISNWQGRLVIIGGAWALVVIIISALVNYSVRTATGPELQLSQSPRQVSITSLPPQVQIQHASPQVAPVK